MGRAVEGGWMGEKDGEEGARGGHGCEKGLGVIIVTPSTATITGLAKRNARALLTVPTATHESPFECRQ